jgi:hypothetical protein
MGLLTVASQLSQETEDATIAEQMVTPLLEELMDLAQRYPEDPVLNKIMSLLNKKQG